MKKTCLILLTVLCAILLTSCGCEHTYSEATCKDLAKCTACGETTGELADHKYTEATCKDLAKCSVCGETTGELAGHKYTEATCKDLAKCSVCGETTGELADHKYTEATCAAPATCAICGKTEGEPLAHQYTEATCTELAKCALCGGTTGELKAHLYSEATCQEVAKCAVCGGTSGEKGAHKYSSGTCTICGHVDEKYQEIAAILKKIERYPTYLKHNVGIMETQRDLYDLTRKTSDFLKIVNTVDEMNNYVLKVLEACGDHKELKLLKDACEDVEYPGVAGSTTSAMRNYLSNANKFKRHCQNVYIVYSVVAKNYGINFTL